MKALEKEQIDDMEKDEMLICCNCARVDTVQVLKELYNGKYYCCTDCKSAALLVYNKDSNELVNDFDD